MKHMGAILICLLLHLHSQTLLHNPFKGSSSSSFSFASRRSQL